LLQKPRNIGYLVLAVGINLERVSKTRLNSVSNTRKHRATLTAIHWVPK
jgi:hypothetical protein